MSAFFKKFWKSPGFFKFHLKKPGKARQKSPGFFGPGFLPLRTLPVFLWLTPFPLPSLLCKSPERTRNWRRLTRHTLFLYPNCLVWYFYSPLTGSIRSFFLWATSSNTVNTGQLRSITVNWGQLKSIKIHWSIHPLAHPSISPFVRPHYNIDESTSKKKARGSTLWWIFILALRLFE